MSSKNNILNKLRKAQQPFTDIEPIKNRRKMVNLDEASLADLATRFSEEAEKLSCYVYHVKDNQEALNTVFSLLEESQAVLAWEDDKLPFPIKEALSEKHIEIAEYNNTFINIGITGVDAGIASTGSLVLSSGQGKFRTASLLPDKHIALINSSQLVPDFETWIQAEKDSGTKAFKESSNTVIISGPSKTADIAQELIKGAHGPRQVHIILIE